MANRWTDLLNRQEIEAQFALTASIDPRFARSQREFYESRTAAQLGALAQQAWNCNEADNYQLARSYAALMTA
jgi:hypothetical protein